MENPFLSSEARRRFQEQASLQQKAFTQEAFSRRQKEREEYEQRKKKINQTISESIEIVENKMVERATKATAMANPMLNRTANKILWWKRKLVAT